MGEKLVKINNEFYSLYDSDGDIVASNNPKTPTTKKLSSKNCEAIANGYDLNDIINENCDKWNTEKANGIEIGFQKALELLGDKKFSEKELTFMFQLGFNLDNAISRNEYVAHIQSLQQTEWDVEIEMEKCGYCEGCNKAGMLHCAHADSCGYPIETERPKLDANGCLILKRK